MSAQGVGVQTGAIDIPSSSISIKVSLVGIAKELLNQQELGQDVEASLQFGVRRAQGAAPFRTGELSNSIGYRMTGPTSGVLEATADHAMPVEMGHRTRSGSFVAARPYLRPSAEETFDFLVERIRRRLESKGLRA